MFKVMFFIEAEKVNKFYRTLNGTVHALEDVSFTVSKGEFVVIVGPSGCGKTTLLKIVAGLLPFESGKVKINGVPLNGPSKSMGLVFQKPVLFKWQKVIDNVLAPIELMGLRKKDYYDRALELLKLTKIEEFKNKYPDQLSGGMQQRVSICRALIHDPDFLLMDEPFGALDAITRDKMGFDLLNIWEKKKKTILFVTHSIPEAIFLADRITVLGQRPAKVLEIIRVDLSRPRDLSMKGSKTFGDYTLRLHDLLL